MYSMATETEAESVGQPQFKQGGESTACLIVEEFVDNNLPKQEVQILSTEPEPACDVVQD